MYFFFVCFVMFPRVCVSFNTSIYVSVNVHPPVYDEGWWRNWQLSGQWQEEERRGRRPEIELDPTPTRVRKILKGPARKDVKIKLDLEKTSKLSWTSGPAKQTWKNLKMLEVRALQAFLWHHRPA